VKSKLILCIVLFCVPAESFRHAAYIRRMNGSTIQADGNAALVGENVWPMSRVYVMGKVGDKFLWI